MLYFFSGENDFSALREILQFKQKFLQNKSLANVDVFDLEEEGQTEKMLEKISSGSGFFADKSFLVIKNFGRLNVGEEKKLLSGLKKRNQSDEIIFFQKSEKIPKGKLTDYLKKEAQTKNFPLLSLLEIKNWARGEMEKRSEGKVVFDQGALERLIFLTKENLWQIDNEIDRLINFIDQGRVSCQTVDFFLENRASIGAFDLADALGNKDKKRAMNILLAMLKNKEDGFLIFGSIINLHRNLAKVYALAKKGKTPGSEEAGKLKMHPFVVQKTFNQLRNFSFSEIKNFYSLALKLDEEVKLGKLKIEEALVEIVGRMKG